MHSVENPLDRNGATVLVRALDTVVAVRFPPGSEAPEEFRRLWSRALVDGFVEPNATVEVSLSDPSERVQHDLSSRITLAAIDVRSRDLWMLHAAGLADPTGRAVALVAPSGTGKTTAAAHLGRTWAYLSDETVGVDARGLVAVHPKPLSLVVPGALVKQQVGPDQAGLVAPAPGHPIRLVAIVLLKRDGTSPPRVESVGRTQALVQVAEQTSYLGRLPRPLHFLNDILDGLENLYSVAYGDVAELDPVIAGLLAGAAVGDRR
ncbi:MAG: hypothetical protein NTX33_06775 [Propionibacteriales bacterium]|nr:hypothetical protein [Propionibacteriales bacterium]